MKQYIYLVPILILFLSANTLGAQKLKKEKLNNTVYMQPQASMALDDATTYNMTVLLRNHDDFRRRSAIKEFKTKEFKKVGSSSKGDFTITVTERKFGFTMPRTRVYNHKSKDAEGGSVKRYKVKGKVLYKYDMIVEKNGMEIYKTTYEGDASANGPKMDTEEMARMCYDKGKEVLDDKIVRRAINFFEEEFNNHFTSVQKTASPKIFVIDRPTKDQALFASSTDKILELDQSRMSESAKNDARMEVINDYMSFLTQLEKTKKSKKATKLRAATHYNIGHTYFMMGDYASAEHHLSKSNNMVEFNLQQEKLLDSASLCADRISTVRVK